MQSPITGKEMILKREKRSISFRKEEFEIVYHYYQCEESGEQFTDTALDELNLTQVYNQYRDKFNIPFPEEIVDIRKQYGLSARVISSILGLGINSYRQYEAGEMPSVSNARLIQMAADPKQFKEMISLYELPNEEKKRKYLQKAEVVNLKRKKNRSLVGLRNYLMGNALPDIYSGYKSPDLEKLTEMVVFFGEHIQPYKTKMNKLLFYVDFLSFRESCFSISGLRYRAIKRGPVPYNFQSIFEYLANEGNIEIDYVPFPQGYIGEKFCSKKDRFFKSALFSTSELAILERVAKVFKSTTTQDIIKKSHFEKAWLENKQNKSLISYEYAFDLNEL